MTMVVEAWQNYINMISGVTKATRSKALATARGVLAQAGLEDVAVDAGDRVTKLAEEILNASRANRQLMEQTVGSEIDKAAARWGFVRAEELEEVREELAELRLSLAHQVTRAGPDLDAPAPETPAKKVAPAKKAPAKKAPAKKAPAKKTPAKQTTTKQTPVNKAPAKKVAPAKKAGATKKAATETVTTKKTPAKKTPAKKTTPAKKAAAARKTAPRAAVRPAGPGSE